MLGPFVFFKLELFLQTYFGKAACQYFGKAACQSTFVVDHDDRLRQFAGQAFNNLDVNRNFGPIVDENELFSDHGSKIFQHVLARDLLLRGARADTTTIEGFCPMLTDWPNEEFPIENRHDIFLIYSMLKDKPMSIVDTRIQCYRSVKSSARMRTRATKSCTHCTPHGRGE